MLPFFCSREMGLSRPQPHTHEPSPPTTRMPLWPAASPAGSAAAAPARPLARSTPRGAVDKAAGATGGSGCVAGIAASETGSCRCCCSCCQCSFRASCSACCPSWSIARSWTVSSAAARSSGGSSSARPSAGTPSDSASAATAAGGAASRMSTAESAAAAGAGRLAAPERDGAGWRAAAAVPAAGALPGGSGGATSHTGMPSLGFTTRVSASTPQGEGPQGLFNFCCSAALSRRRSVPAGDCQTLPPLGHLALECCCSTRAPSWWRRCQCAPGWLCAVPRSGLAHLLAAAAQAAGQTAGAGTGRSCRTCTSHAASRCKAAGEKGCGRPRKQSARTCQGCSKQIRLCSLQAAAAPMSACLAFPARPMPHACPRHPTHRHGEG